MQAPPPPPPADYDIDDDDSEDQATMMMDASSGDVQAAIEAALASAPEAPGGAWDDEDDGGQRTIGLAEAGLDFSDVPDPTGGTDSVRPTPAAGRPLPAAGAPGPAAGLAAPPARPQLSSKPSLPEDLQATAAFPEDMIAAMMGDDLAGSPQDESLEAPPGGALGAPSDLRGVPMGGGPLGDVPAGLGDPAASTPRPVEMFVPEVEETGGSGLKVALIVATVVLVLVVVGVVLLYLDRQGTVDLGI